MENTAVVLLQLLQKLSFAVPLITCCKRTILAKNVIRKSYDCLSGGIKISRQPRPFCGNVNLLFSRNTFLITSQSLLTVVMVPAQPVVQLSPSVSSQLLRTLVIDYWRIIG
jgi:hypothetical protein